MKMAWERAEKGGTSAVSKNWEANLLARIIINYSVLLIYDLDHVYSEWICRILGRGEFFCLSECRSKYLRAETNQLSTSKRIMLIGRLRLVLTFIQEQFNFLEKHLEILFVQIS